MTPPEPAPSRPARLVLREWQLWNTYASFYRAPLPPLEAVPERLVRYGVAECAVTSDGREFWSADDERAPVRRGDRRREPIGRGTVGVERTHTRLSAEFRIPPGVEGHEYALQSFA